MRVLIIGSGGREHALARAYEAVRRISFDGMWYREDIGEF